MTTVSDGPYFKSHTDALGRMKGNQRLRFDETRAGNTDGAWYIKGHTGLRGRVAAWASGLRGTGNYTAMKAVKAEFAKANGGETMSANERFALRETRNAALTKKRFDFLGEVRAGNAETKLQRKFGEIGAQTPHKIHLHDARRLYGPAYLVGRGGFNSVYGRLYESGESDQKVEWIMKPLTTAIADPLVDVGLHAQRVRHPAVATRTGIDHDNPRWGDRNIASYKLGTLIGMPVFVEAEFGVSEGEPVLAMRRADGDLASKVIAKDFELANNPAIQQAYSNAQFGLFLNGGGDCHDENCFIDVSAGGKTVRMTVIDNDQSFGWKMLDPNRPPGVKKGEKHPFHSLGFPPALDVAAYDAVMKLQNKSDRDALIEEMKPHLDTIEIHALNNRIDLAIEHAEDLEEKGLVIEDWETWTARGGEPAAPGGYWQAVKNADKVIGHDGDEVPPSMLYRDLCWSHPTQAKDLLT